MGHSCRAHSSYETSSKSHAARLQDELFVRDFLQKSRVKSQKRAFRTRLPPKITRQVSKTSVSYETSSKSHMSSPQNERFVSKTHMSKSAKRTFRTRLPPKVQRKHPSEHTHHAALPSSFAIPAPPNDTRSHANPNVTNSTDLSILVWRTGTGDSDIHLYHNSQPPDSLRLPRIFPRPHV